MSLLFTMGIAVATLYVLYIACMSTVSAIKFVSNPFAKVQSSASQSLPRSSRASMSLFSGLFNVNPRVEIKDYIETKVELEISKSVAMIINKIEEGNKENAKKIDEFSKENSKIIDELSKKVDNTSKENSKNIDELSKKVDNISKENSKIIDELSKKVDNIGSKILSAELFLSAFVACVTIVFSIPGTVGKFLTGILARLRGQGS